MLRSFSFLISLWDFAKVCTFVDGVGGVTGGEGGGQGEGRGREGKGGQGRAAKNCLAISDQILTVFANNPKI